MQITLGELREAVAVYLGWGDATLRTAEQTARINGCVRRGIRQYLYPKHPVTQEIHVWSFLRGALLTVELVAGQTTYELPEGFGGFESPLQDASGVYAPHVTIMPLSEIISLRARNPGQTGNPVFAATTPAFTAAGGQQWNLEVFPEPAVDGTLTAQYCITPDMPEDDADLLPGGNGHAEGYTESCLAAAESSVNDDAGLHTQLFAEALVNAIHRDVRASTPQTLGSLPLQRGGNSWTAGRNVEIQEIEP